MRSKLLYVVGHPRCGSTIFGNVLSQAPGVFHAGELHYLWTPGLPEPRKLCGCGAPLRSCSLWRRIFAAAFQVPDRRASGDAEPEAPPAWGLPGVDPLHVHLLQKRALSAVATARTIARGGGQPPPGPVAEYLEVMGRIYRGIARVTGASLIVDSSKWPADGALIGSLGAVDLAYVHLVREPWGAVYSRLPRAVPGEPASAGPPSRARVLIESLRWVRSNAMAEIVVRRARRKGMTVHYERFATEPAEVVRRVGKLVDLDLDLPSLDAGEIVLSTNHSTGGNRNRWRSGKTVIRPDRKWQEGLRHGDRRLISWSTWPYRRHLGYASS